MIAAQGGVAGSLDPTVTVAQYPPIPLSLTASLHGMPSQRPDASVTGPGWATAPATLTKHTKLAALAISARQRCIAAILAR